MIRLTIEVEADEKDSQFMQNAALAFEQWLIEGRIFGPQRNSRVTLAQNVNGIVTTINYHNNSGEHWSQVKYSIGQGDQSQLPLWES